mmetsp:Transcript_29338/g.70570  ORF Transcript_29338/g.70570 Transcript_29338/m.70570 type:complete len:85 (+) Transcript_29338:673-927(+)
MITNLDEIPDMSMIETAFIFVVRNILQGSLKECNIRCDPDMPQVEKDGSTAMIPFDGKTEEQFLNRIKRFEQNFPSYREAEEAG